MLDRMRNSRGFTLVEIMIVVAIIGILAVIAVPNFVRVRQRARTNACVANLRQVHSAAVLYSLDEGSAPGDVATLEGPYLQSEPTCPIDGASYTITADAGGVVSVTCTNYNADTHPATLTD